MIDNSGMILGGGGEGEKGRSYMATIVRYIVVGRISARTYDAMLMS